MARRSASTRRPRTRRHGLSVSLYAVRSSRRSAIEADDPETLGDKSGAAKRYNQSGGLSQPLKIVRLRPGSGDPRSAEAVYRVLVQSLDALYSTARRLTGRADLAEDLVQDTARRALEAIPALKDERNTRAWLFRILLNAIRNYLRRKKLWEEVEIDERTADTDMKFGWLENPITIP